MLETIFTSKNKEKILLYIEARKEGYAREIAKYYGCGLSPIQNQLEKLEIGSLLSSRSIGKTRVYYFNLRYPFLKEIRTLLAKAIQFLPASEQERLLVFRRRPRRKDKPL